MQYYRFISILEDRQRYIDIYNRNMRYAPYTLPLTIDLLDNHILKEYNEESQLCLIGRNVQGEGILHGGLYQNDALDGGSEIGLVYLLLGDNNNIAEHLLREAEAWFENKKINLVRACNWRPNAYKYILHGTETYVWGGAIPTINAYRRLGYDLQAESVIMICKMDQEPIVPFPDIPDLCIVDEPQMEDDLICKSNIRALVGGKEAGHCTYDFLKAISHHLGKPIGQIAIGIDDRFFGKGLGQALLLGAHRALFRLGARQVMLHTVQGLFRAIKLYEKVGYTEQNIRGFCFEKEFERDL